tara:strand:+ start:2562 stop:2720 length:159 start_codon:yes stop_codon:yes gene_type:complete
MLSKQQQQRRRRIRGFLEMCTSSSCIASVVLVTGSVWAAVRILKTYDISGKE